MDCKVYNQYYTDIFDEKGVLITSKCFKGNEVYKNVKDFHVNSYKKYKNKSQRMKKNDLYWLRKKVIG